MDDKSKVDERELHLFILWEKARHQEKKILSDIGDSFTILKQYEITWSKNLFASNLTRFYGTNLPPGSFKEKHVGQGDFLLIIVEDKQPKYSEHETTKGTAVVNSNTFLAKTRHRDWTGGGHKIHATNSQPEFDHDLMLLLGVSREDFLKNLKPSSTEVEKLKTDVIGAKGWDSVEQYFYVLNSTIRYVVMRNFEPLPDKYYADQHGDIDLLVDNYDDVKHISNAEAVFPEPYRVHNRTKIGGQEVLFDFRYVGDSYYDAEWQRDILANRRLERGIYVPDAENHFYSLMYHALMHKPAVADDYIKTLDSLEVVGEKIDKKFFETHAAERTLGTFLAKANYTLTIPDDHSVFVNHDNFQRVRKAMWRTRPVKFALKKAKSLTKR